MISWQLLNIYQKIGGKGTRVIQVLKTGVFPSNYVKIISQLEFEADEEKQHQHQVQSPSYEQNGYSAYGPPATYPPQQLQQQPSYGGYAQYPPPSTNYYPPQQYQQHTTTTITQLVEQQPEQQHSLK